MRKIFLFAIMTFCTAIFSGCTSDSNQAIAIANSKRQVGAFNDETYVWESFIFTTNRVYEVK